MKKDIHPEFHKDCKVTCACGNIMTIGSTLPELTVDVCSLCHPFFTGQMKYLDTAGRVEAFKSRQKSAGGKNVSKTEKRRLKKLKRIQEDRERPESLLELRKKEKKAIEKLKFILRKD